MNRSRFVAAALLGLSLLVVDGERGRLSADEFESIDPQPRGFSTLLDMIGDCTHGAFDWCDSLKQRAPAEQTANDADTGGSVGDEAAYDTSAQVESAEAAIETRPSSNEEVVTQDDVAQYNDAPLDVARKTGEDSSLADEDQISEDAVNPAVDRAIVPPAPTSTDDNEYTGLQDKAAAPASEEKGYENYDSYDGEWNAEAAPVPVAAVPVGKESAADEAVADGPASTAVAAPADDYDGYRDDSQPAIDTHDNGVAAADDNGLDRQTLLGVAGLLDQLGVALQNASQELTWLASKHTDSINQ